MHVCDCVSTDFMYGHRISISVSGVKKIPSKWSFHKTRFEQFDIEGKCVFPALILPLCLPLIFRCFMHWIFMCVVCGVLGGVYAWDWTHSFLCLSWRQPLCFKTTIKVLFLTNTVCPKVWWSKTNARRLLVGHRVVLWKLVCGSMKAEGWGTGQLRVVLHIMNLFKAFCKLHTRTSEFFFLGGSVGWMVGWLVFLFWNSVSH